MAASEDLIWHARRPGPSFASPYEGDPLFDRLFDALARALHRRERPHALLVGERGVGKSALVAEFAGRAARGLFATERVLAVDCRHTPPDEARARLSSVIEYTCPHPDLVVALDGLPGLLLPAHREPNR